MIVPNGTVIMVVDGAAFSLFCNTGEAMAPTLKLMDRSDSPAASTSELGSDRPGRHFESKGPSRGSYEAPDYHQQQKDGFSRDAAEHLNALAAGGTQKLILVAAPHVLGFMRPHLTAATNHALIGEIAKDYTGRPARDIADMLSHYES